MRPSRYALLTGCSLALAVGSAAVAQTPNYPYVEITSTSVNVGIGGQSGSGTLYLPNLGTNCTYPFKVSGFGAGAQVGISKLSASGGVGNMTRVAQLNGSYSAAQGEATIGAGAGVIAMNNSTNNVSMSLRSNTQGLQLGFGGQGMSISLASVPPPNPQTAYVLEFGFNKDYVGQAGRPVLDQVAQAWKCRYGNIWLFGHTDTTGKENSNLDLSAKRAEASRNYLIRAGIAPARVHILPKGENSPLVATANNVRLRTNRAVVVVIQR